MGTLLSPRSLSSAAKKSGLGRERVQQGERVGPVERFLLCVLLPNRHIVEELAIRAAVTGPSSPEDAPTFCLILTLTLILTLILALILNFVLTFG